MEKNKSIGPYEIECRMYISHDSRYVSLQISEKSGIKCFEKITLSDARHKVHRYEFISKLVYEFGAKTLRTVPRSREEGVAIEKLYEGCDSLILDLLKLSPVKFGIEY